MDSTSISKTNFKLEPKITGSFTRFPNELYDILLISNLPLPAVKLVFFIIRHTIGYNRRSLIVEGKVFKELLQVHHSRIPRLIRGLITLDSRI
ncbi:MAG: replication protein [bacterium]|nr:replication protein [bacterium]